MSRSLKSTSINSQSNPTQVEEKSTEVNATLTDKPVMALSLAQLETIVDPIVHGIGLLAAAFPTPADAVDPLQGALRADQARAARAIIAVGLRRPALFRPENPAPDQPPIDFAGSSAALARWEVLQRLTVAYAQAEEGLARARQQLGEKVRASVDLASPIATAVATIDPEVRALLAPARAVNAKASVSRRKNALPAKRVEAAAALAAKSLARAAKVDAKAARDLARAEALKAKAAQGTSAPAQRATPKNASGA